MTGATPARSFRSICWLGPLFGVLLGLGACSSQTGRLEDYSRYESVRPDLDVEVAHMLMTEFGASAEALLQARVPALVEQQTDAIIAANLTTFGSSLMEGIRRSAWRLQPIGAAYDTAILLEQTRLFLDSDTARRRLGSALPATRELLAEVDELFRLSTREILRDGVEYSTAVEQWVDENHITDIDLVRASPMPQVADDTARRVSDALVAVADTDFAINAFYNRVNSALASMPADVRQQIERAARAVLRESIVVNALVGFARLGDGMKETAAAITAVDRRIDRITTIVLEDIERQRRDTIAEIRAEREAILEAVADERVALMTDLERVVSEQTAEAGSRLQGGVRGATTGLVSGLRSVVLLGLGGLFLVGLVLLLVVFGLSRIPPRP